MTQTNYCQDFNSQLDGIRGGAKTLPALVEELIADFNPQKEDELQKILEDLGLQKDEFTQQYQQQVATLMETWYKQWTPDNPVGLEDPYTLEFDEQNRVIYNGAIRDTRPNIHRTTVNPFIKKPIHYFPQIIRQVNGTVLMGESYVERMDFLEVVNGLLLLRNSSFRSARRLKSVSTLSIDSPFLEAMDSLETVEYDAEFNNTRNLKSLKKLKRVGLKLHLIGTQIGNLDCLEKVGGAFILDGASYDMKKVPNLTEVGAPMTITGFFIPGFRRFFPELRKVGNNSPEDFPTFTVRTDELKKEIEGLRTAHELDFPGYVKSQGQSI